MTTKTPKQPAVLAVRTRPRPVVILDTVILDTVILDTVILDTVIATTLRLVGPVSRRALATFSSKLFIASRVTA